MLPTYGSFPDQESTFTLVPAMGKKCPLEVPELPRSSSSDSSCTLLPELTDGRMRGGTSEVFPAERSAVTRLDVDVEGRVCVGGFGATPLESGPNEDDTFRNPNIFFPNDANIPDDVGVWSVCSPTTCCSSLGPD